MANTYYVGPGGNDANAGTSWALRKLTLNGAEDIPVAAGDTVYVGPGTYRETLTCDVSGSAEAGVISYIGDYTGANTDGNGGVVRITGSDNDYSATRQYGVNINGRTYRTFLGFTIDTVTLASFKANASYTTIKNCYFQNENKTAIDIVGNFTNITIQNCYFIGGRSKEGIYISHSSVVNDTGSVISNCIFNGPSYAIRSNRVGGIVIKNCVFMSNSDRGVVVGTALDAGQTVVVNNSIFYVINVGVAATTTGELVENYNTFYGCATARSNVDVGAQSNSYAPIFDTRWFHELINGGTMITPYDLASYSALINVAGTSPTTADMRGTTVKGTQREWGALEYDSTLDIEAGSGGSVKILPFVGKVGL